MTKVRAPQMWHVYGGEVAWDGLEAWYTLTIKPDVPQEMPLAYTGKLFGTGDKEVTIPYLGSFDHEPTEEEMEELQDQFDSRSAEPIRIVADHRPHGREVAAD